jgi:hypothetical protein
MTRATWPTGTAAPSRVAIVRSSIRSSAARSLGMARATTSTPLLADPQRRHRRSADQGLQRLGDVLWRQAERPGARLVDLEPERRHFLAPIEMRVDQPRIGAHDVAHPQGRFAHDVRLRPNDAELNRKSNRRGRN